MQYLESWEFVAAAAAASFIIGMSRGGFAGGIAFAGVLVMAQVVPPTIAAAFMLPILCFADPFGNIAYRKHIHAASVKVLLPGGLAGIAVGTAIFYLVSDNLIRVFVAGLSFFLVADRLVNHRRHSQAHVYSRPVGYLLGMLAGVSTFIIHAGHPPVSAYLLPQKLPRLLFMGTFALLFTVFNYVKLVPYSWLGLLDWSLLGVAAIFFPVAALGFFFGRWMALKMSDRVFYGVMYVVILLMGIRIGVEGVVGLLAADALPAGHG